MVDGVGEDALDQRQLVDDPRRVGQELGVRYVLEGSVRKSGDRVRVTGQLIDAETGLHLWGDRFDGGAADIFALQDQIVTDRNGRYVLVVRAEHRESIPGIVHGSSASGASLYLEPMATVELNNETVTLAEKESAEVRRILQMLTANFQRRGDELAAAIDAAAEIDLLHAKVETAIVHDGVAPTLVADGRIEFRGARHPLLIERLRAQSGGQVVASDLLVLPPHRALVISGPNTGGKTVALKAFGLLAAMAQAGLLIPVEFGSAFTPFRSIWADIGDDQSISASLSTFSAHIAHLVEMERHLDLPALVLLDEVGGGTDPVEGGALGTAVIDHFLRRGATIVATIAKGVNDDSISMPVRASSITR